MALKLILFLLLTVPQGLHFHHKGVESGLAQMPVNGLYQDENGTLWVGTREGIKYSEGSHFYPLPLTGRNNWVMSNRVPTICGDGDGSIFINANYTVLRYSLEHDNIEVLFTQDDTATPPEVSIHFGPSGLWIGCSGRILLWNHDTGVREVAELSDRKLSISSLLESRSGILWIGTKKDGVIAYDLQDGRKRKAINCNEVISLFADSMGRIWCSSFTQGVFCLDGDDLQCYNTAGTPSLCSDYVRAVAEDSDGRIWIGTAQGIDILDTGAGTIVHQGLSTDEEAGLSNLSIWSILKDRSGTMWIGSYFGGLDYCTDDKVTFEYDDLGFAGNAGPTIICDAVFDKYGTGWFGAEGKAIVRYRDGTSSTLSGHSFPRYNIKSLLLDKDSVNLWISTHMGGLWKYNPKSGKSIHYAINPEDHTSRSESLLSAAWCGNCLLIGTLQGVYMLKPDSKSATPLPEINRHIYEADKLLVSSDSAYVWIIGNSICRYNPSNGVADDFSASLEAISGGSPVTATSIIETGDGSIFVGTAGFGLLKFDRDRHLFVKAPTRSSDFASEYIGPIFETSDGRLLIGTGRGLSWYDPKTGFVDNFEHEYGFPLTSMFAGCITQNAGKLYLGGSGGIAVTTEQQLRDFCTPCSLSLGRMMVNGTVIRPGDGSGLLKTNLRYTKSISLPHDKNNLSFIVGSDTPSHSDQVHYMFKLDGLERDWHTQALALPIGYSSLSPGRYVLRVRNTSTATDEEVSLNIRIRPPFFASWYAWVLYLILLTGIAGFVLYYFYTKTKLTAAVDMERQKMRFFANMSHELRTPLTLLIGKLELFRDKQSLSPAQKSQVDDIHSAATEMIELVNGQMDVLKMGEKALELNPSDADIVSFVRDVASDFGLMAERKGISLKMRSEIPACLMAFDSVQLKKVFRNLLSNAIKYSPQGSGKIRVTVHAPHDGMIDISVKDNGIGIDEQAQSRIFDRFFQSKNAVNSDPSVTGTGIGLYVVSYIVRLHGGNVRLDSRPGKGSTFTVSLPLGRQDRNAAVTAEAAPVPEPAPSRETGRQQPSRKSRLLLVEDDERLRAMLRELFRDSFDVYEADNGQDGLAVAEKTGPELIISDIMMPVMGGDEFCRRIKSDFSTCHIPVILLTALADVEHGIKGFDCGADDYITKPFNSQLLLARSLSIINNRALLQKRWSTDISLESKVLSHNNADIAFMDKLVKLVDDNLLERTITVPFLCEQMAMGHTKLFSKIKGLTGVSPQEFVQNARIKYAARMLRERDDLNVSDVAYQLGFSSLNYFEKCFRKAFGKTPTAFRKQQ